MVHGVPVLLKVEEHVTLEQKCFNVPSVQQTGLVREVNCAFVVFVLMTVVTDCYPGFGPLFTRNYKKSKQKGFFALGRTESRNNEGQEFYKLPKFAAINKMYSKL